MKLSSVCGAGMCYNTPLATFHVLRYWTTISQNTASTSSNSGVHYVANGKVIRKLVVMAALYFNVEALPKLKSRLVRLANE